MGPMGLMRPLSPIGRMRLMGSRSPAISFPSRGSEALSLNAFSDITLRDGKLT